jgi:hypothetical protein
MIDIKAILINDDNLASSKETYSINKLQSLFQDITTAIGNSVTFSYVAGENITMGQIVYIGLDGHAFIADNTNINCMDVIAGIATKDAIMGTSVQVAKFGKISASTGLVAGKHYFLGTAGTVTNVCPLASGSFICGIGAAVDNTTMLLQIGESILIA